MSESLAQATAGYGLLLAAIAAIEAALGRRPGNTLIAGCIVLCAAIGLQIVLSAIALIGGDSPREPGPAAGYLIASVAIPTIGLPVAASESSAWAGAMLAVILVALAVVALRLASVWG